MAIMTIKLYIYSFLKYIKILNVIIYFHLKQPQPIGECNEL
jgi:hypothetical protein